MVINGDGTFPLEIGSGWSATALYTTALGGATVELQANGVALVDGALADDTQYVVTHGKRAPLVVVVSGFVSSFVIETYQV